MPQRGSARRRRRRRPSHPHPVLHAARRDYDAGGWPCYRTARRGDPEGHDEPEHAVADVYEDRELDLPAELSEHLAQGEVAVLEEVGAEKLRYLSATPSRSIIAESRSASTSRRYTKGCGGPAGRTRLRRPSAEASGAAPAEAVLGHRRDLPRVRTEPKIKARPRDHHPPSHGRRALRGQDPTTAKENRCTTSGRTSTP